MYVNVGDALPHAARLRRALVLGSTAGDSSGRGEGVVGKGGGVHHSAGEAAVVGGVVSAGDRSPEFRPWRHSDRWHGELEYRSRQRPDRGQPSNGLGGSTGDLIAGSQGKGPALLSLRIIQERVVLDQIPIVLKPRPALNLHVILDPLGEGDGITVQRIDRCDLLPGSGLVAVVVANRLVVL